MKFAAAIAALAAAGLLCAAEIRLGKPLTVKEPMPLATLLAAASFQPVLTIVTVAKELAQTLGAARRFFAVEDEPVPVRDGPGAELPRQHARVRFEDVSFSYGRGERPAVPRTPRRAGARARSRRALCGAAARPALAVRLRFRQPG